MFYERVFLGNEMLEIALRQDMTYLLRYGDRVEYSNHRRRVGGRTLAYAFRSVEQLRYDFEQDVRKLAENT